MELNDLGIIQENAPIDAIRRSEGVQGQLQEIIEIGAKKAGGGGARTRLGMSLGTTRYRVSDRERPPKRHPIVAELGPGEVPHPALGERRAVRGEGVLLAAPPGHLGSASGPSGLGDVEDDARASSQTFQ